MDIIEGIQMESTRESTIDQFSDQADNLLGFLRSSELPLKGLTEMAEGYRIWPDRIAISYGTQPLTVISQPFIISLLRNVYTIFNPA